MNVLGRMLTKCITAKITTGKSCGNEAPLCGRRSIIERDMQPLEREEIDPYKQKLPLLHGNIVHVSELVMPTGSGRNRPHTTDGGGEEHDTSQTPTFQFREVPWSMGRNNFTVKWA
jgi:hypothetical protein